VNTSLVTTGLVPLVISSVETFQLSSFLNGLPWDLTGGSVTIYFLDPAGVATNFPATIVGPGATYNWMVISPPGTWTRAWLVIDALGRKQKSRPIVFTVTQSP